MARNDAIYADCGCENSACRAASHGNGTGHGCCTSTMQIRCDYIGGLCADCATYMMDSYLHGTMNRSERVIGRWPLPEMPIDLIASELAEWRDVFGSKSAVQYLMDTVVEASRRPEAAQ